MTTGSRDELVARALRGVKPGASGWVRVSCPFCAERTGKPDRKSAFGYNVDSGAYHCFAAETSMITRSGFHPIGELAGSVVEVLSTTADGKCPRWVAAPVESFGEQELWRIVLQRTGVRKEIRATSGHRWFARGGGTRFVEKTTDRLRRGYRLKAVNLPRSGTLLPSAWGVAHGFVFGDGWDGGSRVGGGVNLWGEKDAALVPFFSLDTKTPIWTEGGLPGVRIAGLPRYLKGLPSLAESSTYLYGWLAGYFAADGCVDETGMPTLASASRDHLEFVRRLCLRIGVFTYEVRVQERCGFGTEPSPIYSLSFGRSSLSSEFFVLDEHRRRWAENCAVAERHGWSVVFAEPTGVREEVFCAVVPESSSFALDGHILTGNCFKCGVRGRVSSIALPRVGGEDPRPRPELEEPSHYLPLWEYPGSTAVSTLDARMYLSNRGIAPEMWRKARIGAALSGAHAGRVIVPILDDRGEEWVGWVGRAWVKKAELPYYYPRGMERAGLIYNEAALHTGRDMLPPVVVVEGVFDTFPLWPDGVALLGKADVQQVEALLASPRPIAVVLDGDAWMEGLALAMHLRMRGKQAGAVRLPPGKDPDEVPMSWLWGQICECLNK